MRYIATCKLGLERVVSGELKGLGIAVEQVEDARVLFSGGPEAMARACVWLRSAERVLQEVGSFEARTFDELFEGVKALDWKAYLGKNTFIHVNGKSAKSTLFSVSDCQSITKKAIVENLKAAYGISILPETGERVIVEVGLLRDQVTLALDPCGAGLSRRGYRTYNVTAPISESLGAAILLLSRYRGDKPLLDPMCGSGTFPIEAAMIAQNIAPGLHRSFAGESWRFLPADLFDRARQEAQDRMERRPWPFWAATSMRGASIFVKSTQKRLASWCNGLCGIFGNMERTPPFWPTQAGNRGLWYAILPMENG